MSIISTIEGIIGGFSLAAVKELSTKCAHELLDEVTAKAGKEAGEALASESVKIGIELTPEQASAMVKTVVEYVRSHI